MPDRVIIFGVRRNGERVSAGELRQMAGRAGRLEGQIGYVDFIVEPEDEDYVSSGIWKENSVRIFSVLNDVKVVAFHLLPRIADGTINDESSAETWFSRSFHIYSGNKFDIGLAFRYLVDKGALVAVGNGRYLITPEGYLSVNYYYHPADISCWKDNFSELFAQHLENEDIALAWALGCIEVGKRHGDLGKYRWLSSQFRESLPSGLLSGNSVLTQIMWWHLLGGPSVGPMKSVALEMKDDVGRIISVLKELNGICNWNKLDFIVGIEKRIHKRIPSYLSSLCSVGISKGRAEVLYHAGIMDVEMIMERRKVGETLNMTIDRLLDDIS